MKAKKELQSESSNIDTADLITGIVHALSMYAEDVKAQNLPLEYDKISRILRPLFPIIDGGEEEFVNLVMNHLARETAILKLAALLATSIKKRVRAPQIRTKKITAGIGAKARKILAEDIELMLKREAPYIVFLKAFLDKIHEIERQYYDAAQSDALDREENIKNLSDKKKSLVFDTLCDLMQTAKDQSFAVSAREVEPILRIWLYMPVRNRNSAKPDLTRDPRTDFFISSRSSSLFKLMSENRRIDSVLKEIAQKKWMESQPEADCLCEAYTDSELRDCMPISPSILRVLNDSYHDLCEMYYPFGVSKLSEVA